MGLREERLVESVLFSASKPVGIEEIKEASGLSKKKVTEALESLIQTYNIERKKETSIEVIKAGDKYTMQVKKKFFDQSVMIAKPEMVKVPNVVGKKKEETIGIIESAKLKMGRILEKKSEKPPDTVIEQIPEAGKEVPVGTSINLVVAKPEMVKVPNVVRKKKEEAIGIIESAKLKVGRILEKESKEPPGIVIEQRPQAGEGIPVGSPIDLVIAKSERVRVPNAVGKKKEETGNLRV